MQCASEYVHCITRGITHAYILNTYCPAWRAVHMLSLTVSETLIVYYASNPPHELHMALLTPKDLHIPP